MRSVKHTAGFDIDQPVGRVFPLFSPEGEKAWVPGWDYANVMGTTDLSEDYVFLTRSHDHASAEAIWLVKRYEPENGHIQLYRVEPGQKVGAITIRCTPVGEEQTHVDVTYEYIAISAEGQRFVAGFTLAAYETFINEWQELLVRYLDPA